jgi:hypothetical protein
MKIRLVVFAFFPAEEREHKYDEARNHYSVCERA